MPGLWWPSLSAVGALELPGAVPVKSALLLPRDSAQWAMPAMMAETVLVSKESFAIKVW